MKKKNFFEGLLVMAMGFSMMGCSSSSENDKIENGTEDEETPVAQNPIAGVWNVDVPSKYETDKFIFYFFENGLFTSTFIPQDDNLWGPYLGDEYYNLTGNTLTFDGTQFDHIENVVLVELSESAFVFEADVIRDSYGNAEKRTFNGIRKENVDRRLTTSNLQKLIGTWEIIKNEDFEYWHSDDKEILTVSTDGTFNNTYYDYEPYTYNGSYAVMGKYVMFTEPEGKDPLGRLFVIETLTDESLVLATDENKRVYGIRK